MRNSTTSLCERIFKNMESKFQFEHLLDQHIKHQDFRVRLALLRHPYCQQKHLEKFIEDPSWQVLSALADRKDLPEELYRYLYKYKKGLHSFLDFTLEQHPLKKIIGIDGQCQYSKQDK